MKNKGQMTIIGVITTLITLVVVSLAFMPVYKNIVENSTAGWNSSEVLIFSSIGVVMILSIIIGLLNYAAVVREQRGY